MLVASCFQNQAGGICTRSWPPPVFEALLRFFCHREMPGIPKSPRCHDCKRRKVKVREKRKTLHLVSLFNVRERGFEPRRGHSKANQRSVICDGLFAPLAPEQASTVKAPQAPPNSFTMAATHPKRPLGWKRSGLNGRWARLHS